MHFSIRGPLAALLLSLLPPAGRADAMTKILVDRDGVYRVTDHDLAGAGVAIPGGEIDRLRLTLRGQEVPIRLETRPAAGPDGRFAFEFLGLFPRGTATWEDPYTKTNVYVLDAAPAGTKPARIALERAARAGGRLPVNISSPARVHFEVNRKLVRFTGDKTPDETWFWDEIKGTDPQARTFTFHLDDVQSPATCGIHVRMMGHSSLPENPDHTVELAFNGTPLGKAAWDGETVHTFEAPLASGLLKNGENVLSLRASGETTNGIDLVLVDWVELSYPAVNRIGASGQKAIWADSRSVASLRDTGAGTLRLYDSTAPRVFELPASVREVDFVPPGIPKADTRSPEAIRGRAAGLFYAVRNGAAFRPEKIVHTSPRDLKADGLGADFVIVSHSSFMAAAGRLAAARRDEGLRTEVVDVADLYDGFADGFLQPEAIERFLEHAYNRWNPRPRYVLLVGDASWDYKNDLVADDDYADWHWQLRPEWHFDISKNGSTPYRNRTDKNDRQFIPTYQYQSPWGHAATDNYFAALGKPLGVPKIAVGRLTVVTPEEANAVVDKILGYSRLESHALTTGLFVTNGEEGFVAQTDNLAQAAEREGYRIERVYPKVEGKARFASTKSLQEGFDREPALVLFIGHGGRYVWNIGAENVGGAYDLFGLQHVDELKDVAGLPVVVSLTCYSAPFDHPIADSIGEKLLRSPHKGAIAVIAASWRNAPPVELGRKLIQLLGDPNAPRIGDAFVKGKEAMPSDTLTLATYNLLGDPTVPYRGPLPILTARKSLPPAPSAAPAAPAAPGSSAVSSHAP